MWTQDMCLCARARVFVCKQSVQGLNDTLLLFE